MHKLYIIEIQRIGKLSVHSTTDSTVYLQSHLNSIITITSARPPPQKCIVPFATNNLQSVWLPVASLT